MVTPPATMLAMPQPFAEAYCWVLNWLPVAKSVVGMGSEYILLMFGCGCSERLVWNELSVLKAQARSWAFTPVQRSAATAIKKSDFFMVYVCFKSGAKLRFFPDMAKCFKG